MVPSDRVTSDCVKTSRLAASDAVGRSCTFSSSVANRCRASVQNPSTRSNPMEQAEARNVHELVELSLYQVETAAYETLGIESMNRPHWIISHVLRGDVETETEGSVTRARAGDVMIHPPGVPFSERAKGPGCHEWLELEMKVSPSAEVFRLYPVAYVVKLSSPPEFSRVFEKLESSFGAPASHTRDLRIG